MPNMPSVSFEFFPPRTEEGDIKLNKTIKILSEFNPEFFSVTFGAGGSTKAKTLETVLSIKSSNNNGVPHLSCISASKEEIRTLLNEYKTHDIKHLVALRGDNPSGAISHGDFKYANELISFIREETGEYFYIDAGAYPEYHPEADSATDDFNNFKRKIEAGANSAITQFFFNVDAYFRFIEECQKKSISVPIVPGIMPIYNIKQLSRFSSNCGAEIPRWLRLKLESYGDDIVSLRAFGVDVISELCETLIQYGVPSIHFYTLNESGIITKIINNIKS
ncbi:methylenetetrahydrofolate reductase [NAD(P)H] [Methylophilaceae bacterium]|nr:methylenetetrahydrofolate reductase [NAD(P)H] [Methylophilaceae bacterium]MDC1173660.1 methylenetetrahydrofolate reductase [NAD(P)H] [Methylophilaceae bacterium]